MLFTIGLAVPANAVEHGRITGKFDGSTGGVRILLTDTKGNSASGSVFPDSAGRYRFDKVAPGDYHIRYIWKDETDQWFPGQIKRQLAKVVQVRAGEEFVADDTELKPGSVRATITDAVTGKPIKGACVWMTKAPYSRSLCSGEDGVARFSRLRAWNWNFVANTLVGGYVAGYVDNVDVLPEVTTDLAISLTPKP
ncbi:hypothetical protein [Kibdelosporangium phytohabitans]|uniref:Uncharacterized protein n=1 Tax=Kibdelosporangium phytohabitans TaxID=860235 RepID=A0A0N9I7Z2_9PSEU|nr:hypothetical protein [Kibdelosporangium phytohabitans]ALG12300.1 hypothetical protein AOZ06_40445 [Kibdelosporangium phytohabitans]MBE1463857.1 putative surface anchored protein [Kibdelosporangium phytohabitans]